MKQARGFYHKGKGQGGGKGGSSASHGGKGAGSDRIKKLKARTHCAICGRLDRWKGDAGGQGPGARKAHMTAAESDSTQEAEGASVSEQYFTSAGMQEQQIAAQSFFIGDVMMTLAGPLNVVMAMRE